MKDNFFNTQIIPSKENINQVIYTKLEQAIKSKNTHEINYLTDYLLNNQSYAWCEDNDTPIRMAVHYGLYDFFKKLIEKYKEPSSEAFKEQFLNEEENNPLHSGFEALFSAVKYHRTQMVKDLLGFARTQTKKQESYQIWCDNALRQAIIADNVKLIKSLLCDSELSVNPASEHNKALQLATQQGSIDIIKELLNNAACTEQITSQKDDSINLALKHNHNDALLLLNATYLNVSSKQSLMQPVNNDELTVLNYLLPIHHHTSLSGSKELAMAKAAKDSQISLSQWQDAATLKPLELTSRLWHKKATQQEMTFTENIQSIIPQPIGPHTAEV
ncbi:MAG: ankyrin repeat domain-containing protein, partial [Burkholderiales bacterium]